MVKFKNAKYMLENPGKVLNNRRKNTFSNQELFYIHLLKLWDIEVLIKQCIMEIYQCPQFYFARIKISRVDSSQYATNAFILNC